MPIYTIATATDVVYGHGSSGVSWRICKEGSYETGNYPPAFKTKKEAQEYLDGLGCTPITDPKKVVLLEVKE